MSEYEKKETKQNGMQGSQWM